MDTSKLIEHWKADPSCTYVSWFLWEERLKNFRSIRAGIQVVISEISAGRFGNTYRDSSLETVVHSIAEQKQMFKGADHAFLWKPKLRIPDIYENSENQKRFGKFLDTCLACCDERGLVDAVNALNEFKIKGLGPAAANLLYFLHPTIVPPFNTAIVKGYNLLTGSKVKLGKWEEYLAMRAGIIRLNETYRSQLSNDLGAIAGLLFDLGSGRIPVPAAKVSDEQWLADLEAIRSTVKSRSTKKDDNDVGHTEVQGWLRDLGLQLGFNVWIASNDRNRPYNGGKLADGCLAELNTDFASDNGDAVKLIDVLWLNGKSIVAAFEVEHSTSIYSGVLRMLDLAYSPQGANLKGIFLVAPDKREDDVCGQLARPAFRKISNLEVRFLPYTELEKHREVMGRFGEGLKAITAISRKVAQ